jgi:signal transduction histidine kinase
LVEAESFTPRPGSGAVQSALRLLGARSDNCVVLLCVRQGGTHLRIEDLHPRSALVGHLLPLPADLSMTGHRLRTAGVRLPLGWTEACGSRPAQIVAVPIAGHEHHLVVASTIDGAPDMDAISATAEVLSELLHLGRTTQRERNSSRQLGTLIDNLPGPLVFVDSRELCVLLNEEARSLLDLPSGDLQEHDVAAALARLMRSDDEDGHRPKLTADLRASFAFEIANGARRYKVESCWIDREDLAGRIWQFSDITLEKAYQAEQANLASLLQLTVENVGDGVALVDDMMRLGLWNAMFRELLAGPTLAIGRGDDLPSLIERSAEAGLFGAAYPATIRNDVAACLGGAATDPIEVNRDDGRVLDLRRQPLPDGGCILIVRDVSVERQMARLKEDFVSTVSHELRTPLTSIMGSLQLFRATASGQLAPEALSLIGIAERNGQRLNRLVNDLLDLDKLQSGSLVLARQPTDMARFLADAVEQTSPYAARFSVSIELDLPARPVSAMLDQLRMSQVLGNLLSNAAKFSPPESSVVVRLTTPPDRICISVIDQGPGVSPAFRERLFTRFAQDMTRLPDRPAGTGLGLAIARGIVEQHGGRLYLDTETSIGATFHVELPHPSRE